MWGVCGSRGGAAERPNAPIAPPLPPLPQVFTITTPQEQEAAADAFVRRLSPGARLTYALAGTRRYELPVGEVSLPTVFDAVGAARDSDEFQVLDWGVANATLEEVFIKFAKEMGLGQTLH